MSPRTDWQTNEDRRLAAKASTGPKSRLERVGRWLWTSGYQGLAQVFLLCAPVLWLVFRSPRSGSVVKPVALVLVTVTPLVVGAFREGFVSVGRPWPTLTNDSLSFTGGYWAVFRRAVLLNNVLAVACYGGALVGVATGSLPVAVAVGVVTVVAGVSVVPAVTPETRAATLGRVSLAVAALGLVVAVADPFAGNPRFRTAPAAFALLVSLSIVDLRPWRWAE